jgi:hypothetical protein
MVAAMVALGAVVLQAGSNPRCLADLVAPTGSRATTRAVKGVEIYSWKAPDGTMRFSFLFGTNRLKTEREVKSPACALSSTTQVKTVLTRLAEGEQVYWGGDARECPSCSVPNQEVVTELTAYASRLGITIHARLGQPDD